MSTLTAITPAPSSAKPGGGYQTIGLIGPPNVGKTTLFNRLTGMRQKVSNYSGVTVEHRKGRLKTGQTIIDLPGVWSLTPESEDQKIAVNVLHGTQVGVPKLDAVLLVVDGTQLQRYLTLVSEVLTCGLPTLVLINMADELEARSGYIDPLCRGARHWSAGWLNQRKPRHGHGHRGTFSAERACCGAVAASAAAGWQRSHVVRSGLQRSD